MRTLLGWRPSDEVKDGLPGTTGECLIRHCEHSVYRAENQNSVGLGVSARIGFRRVASKLKFRPAAAAFSRSRFVMVMGMVSFSNDDFLRATKAVRAVALGRRSRSASAKSHHPCTHSLAPGPKRRTENGNRGLSKRA